MASACEELDEFARVALRGAIASGQTRILLWREGKKEPGGDEIKAQMDNLVLCGFFERGSVTGTKSRVTGGAQWASYNITAAGRVAIEALDRAERAEARLAELGEKPPTPGKRLRRKV